MATLVETLAKAYHLDQVHADRASAIAHVIEHHVAADDAGVAEMRAKRDALEAFLRHPKSAGRCHISKIHFELLDAALR